MKNFDTTSKNERQEIIAQISALLMRLIETADNVPKTEDTPENPIEMLTIKECVASVKGLSEHTVRQLVAQNKIPYIRVGQGKKGKILISRSALLKYLGGME